MRVGKSKRFFCLFLILCLFLLSAGSAAAAGPVRSKIAAMTFDDGPNRTITPQLLDELAARNVKCTFFMLGLYAELYPELVERAYNEGHQIASHTYNHKILSQQTDATIRQEVESTRKVLSEITGEENFMVRLPYGDGNNSSRVLNCINAPVILWSVDATNGKVPYTEESLYNGILNQIRDGAIILMHDSTTSNMNAALRAIDTLQAEGWTFVTVEELFRIRNAEAKDNTVYYSVPYAGEWYNESRLSEHWAYPSISRAMETGLMQGDGTGFKPNEYLTRAMAVTILWRTEGDPASETKMPFSDVPADTWYTEAVRWGAGSGIVNGVSSELFAPNDMVSREQFCALLVRLATARGNTLPSVGAARVYSDSARVSAWAAGDVSAVWNAGFVSANDASAFRPRDSLTRAEAAEMLVWFESID